MFRQLIIVVAATFLSAVTAHAGTPSVPSASYDWSGIYVGAHGGIGAADFEIAPGSTSAPGTPGSDLDFEDALFGPVIGINFQDGVFVYGFEGDASFGDFEKTNSVFTVPSMDIKAIGTIRGRVGLAFDRLLVFGTLGVGIAGVDSSERGGLGKDSNVHFGLVAGIGAEYAISQSLIGRVGLMAGWYDEEKYFYGPPHPVPHSHVIDFQTLVGRVSILWKFDTPLLAGD